MRELAAPKGASDDAFRHWYVRYSHIATLRGNPGVRTEALYDAFYHFRMMNPKLLPADCRDHARVCRRLFRGMENLD